MLVGVLILLGLIVIELALLARGKKPGMSTFTAAAAGMLLLILIVRAIVD